MAIEFSCQCGNLFRLDDDEAGAEIQCVNCGRLNDVPLPSDLKRISEDGTFQLDEAPVLNNPKAAAELLYVYSQHEHDRDGYQKDLRLTDEESRHIGRGEPVPISADQTPIPTGPRYDPETGELIREIEIAPPDARHVIGAQQAPIPVATLAYATADMPGTLTFTSAFLHLFHPGSLAVMGALFLMHAFSWPLLGVILNGMIFLGFAIPFFLIGMVGHYGNIVDDIGPGERDELPRPFRDLHFYDDLWLPFCNFGAALMICYLPISIAGLLDGYGIIPTPMAALLSAVLAGLGSFFFPAVFLTLQTSGTPANLRPDRVLRVIAASGPMYFPLTALWILASVAYLWGILGPSYAMFIMMEMGAVRPWPVFWRLTVPLLLCGIFLMHYFCFCLGLLYRAHHADFPWVWQRHVRTKPAGVTAGPSAPQRKPAAPRKPT